MGVFKAINVNETYVHFPLAAKPFAQRRMAIENGLGDQKFNRFGNYALNPNRTPGALGGSTLS